MKYLNRLIITLTLILCYATLTSCSDDEPVNVYSSLLHSYPKQNITLTFNGITIENTEDAYIKLPIGNTIPDSNVDAQADLLLTLNFFSCNINQHAIVATVQDGFVNFTGKTINGTSSYEINGTCDGVHLNIDVTYRPNLTDSEPATAATIEFVLDADNLCIPQANYHDAPIIEWNGVEYTQHEFAKMAFTPLIKLWKQRLGATIVIVKYDYENLCVDVFTKKDEDSEPQLVAGKSILCPNNIHLITPHRGKFIIDNFLLSDDLEHYDMKQDAYNNFYTHFSLNYDSYSYQIDPTIRYSQNMQYLFSAEYVRDYFSSIGDSESANLLQALINSNGGNNYGIALYGRLK
ncbi:MAG: hypothetical protein ACI4BH_11650 [Muribaculaceae bacterium]